MDRIRYSFEEGERQLAALERLLREAEGCRGRLKRALRELTGLGDGETVRRLSLELRLSQDHLAKWLESAEILCRALRENQRRFEETERELARAVLSLSPEGEAMGRRREPSSGHAPPQCLIGEYGLDHRVFYPAWLSDAARRYYAGQGMG